MLLVKNIKLPPSHTQSMLEKKAAQQLNTTEKNIKELKIIKKSIDARKSPMYVYTVAVSLLNAEGITGEEYKPVKALPIIHKRLAKRPVVAGFGPGGMFAALTLAKSGCEPIVLERGKKASERARDIEAFRQGAPLCENSNIQFGEGGAGTFSDGKLATGISSPYIKNVLQTFVDMGAQEEILYSAKPHIGSDILPKVVSNIRHEIERLGGEVRFNTRLDGIKVKNESICGVYTQDDELETDTLLLAIGHSARDTFEMLYKNNTLMQAKPFSVGCRIEHLQSDISKAQYAADARLLPPADYKLSCHLKNGLSVYTFCMCPGGYVVNSSSEQFGIVTNGYSESDRGGTNANSALLVGVTPEIFGKHPLAGIEFQRKIEGRAYEISGSYKAPCQTVGDFLAGRASTGFGDIKPTYSAGVVASDISLCLPDFAAGALREGIKLFAKRLGGFDRSDALLTAPETRSSSPLRIVRTDDMQGSIRGLYPIGEGSGYAGGITSSAVDGIRAAIRILGGEN